MAEESIVAKKSLFERKMSVSNVIVALALCLLFGIGIGSITDPLRSYINEKIENAAPTGDLGDKNFSLYWEVYNTLRQYYVDPTKLDADTLFYGSVKGLVESLGDAPTAFFDPDETKEYKKSQSGSYSGIGAELDYVNKMVVVVSPFDGSPAQQAGLESQDIIVKVNGVSTASKSLTQVVSEIRGEAGTTVTLDIVRPRENNKSYTLEMTRGNISAPSITMKDTQDGVAIVKVSRFTEATLAEWVSKWNVVSQDIARQYENGNITGVVIDLRNNPGGYFDAAIVLAGDFLPKESVVAYQREKSGQDQIFATTTTPRLKDIPVVLLVNGSSASASEIFAGALQYYKRATVVGEKTYGKGTAQVVVDLKDGSSVHVTVSKWLLPDKEWLNPENPITPDKEVVYDYDQRAEGKDNQLDEAVGLLKK